VSRLAAVVFGVLVIATFGAFFGAQRLKNAPPVLSRLSVFPYFSPNSDGRHDVARVSFEVKETDNVTVAVLNSEDDEVRELMGTRRLMAGELTRLKWDGRDDDGTLLPDGRYRYRITLQHEGRSVIPATSVRLDTTPPRPRVISVGPTKGPGPEVLPLPEGGPAEVHLLAPGRDPVIRLFKMSPGVPRLVLQDDKLRDGAKEWFWDGRTPSGHPVSPGTYLVSIETRDLAGNRGLSPALTRGGLPAITYGAKLPGRGGIRVSYLAAQPPPTPVTAGSPATFLVDSRRKPYTWTVRRVGSSAVIKRGRKTKPKLRIFAPGGKSGTYLLQIRTATRTTTVPFAVQSREQRSVLVALPVMTWQGRNPIDDDGDGLPNLLDDGLGAKLFRVYAGDGLPEGFADRDAPLLAWLDRNHHRYDITTDFALASGTGPRLQGHKAVILPSDVRWLPRALQLSLRRFVRGGGKLASFGVDSLRRQVSISPRKRLIVPTPPASTDIFGARLRRLQGLANGTRLVEAGDKIGLFEGTTGAFGPFARFQEADLSPAPLSSAIAEDPQTGRPVIAVSRLGKGLVFRFPVPDLPAHLSARSNDPQTVALLQRTWTLLSH
jgi:flagellar hook assembly protein FlgD